MPRFRTLALAASIATLSLLISPSFRCHAGSDRAVARTPTPRSLSSTDLETLVARIAYIRRSRRADHFRCAQSLPIVQADRY